MSISGTRPCGIYVSVADLVTAVSGAQGASPETVNKVLSLMKEQWTNAELVDVMLMAECFWNWQYEITKAGADMLRNFDFRLIMDRIKNDKIVPTVGRRNDPKN